MKCLFYDYTTRYSNLVGAFRGYVSPVVAAVGIIGNLAIITVFAKEKPRTRFSIFAISLAIAHITSLIFNTIMDDFFGRGLFYVTSGRFVIKFDTLSSFSCKIMEYIPNVMYFASSYLIVAFAIDRLVTLQDPFRFNSCRFCHRAAMTCLCVFFVGMIGNLSTLQVQTLMSYGDAGQNFTCQMDRTWPKLASFSIFFQTLVIFIIPLFLVLFLNSLLLFRIRAIHRWRRINAPMGFHKYGQEIGRVCGHLALSTVFLLLYIPLAFVILVRLHFTEIHGDDKSESALHIVDLTKFFSSTKDITYAVNLLLYFAFLENFRKRFLKHFCRWGKRGHLNPPRVHL